MLRSGAVGSATRGASAPTEGGEVQGHIVAAPAQLVANAWLNYLKSNIANISKTSITARI